MEYTTFGKTGLRVSKLGLGGAPIGGDFGDQVDDTIVQRVVDEAIDLGINFIDTAPLYGNGKSEERIGRALEGKRNRVVLATKAVKRGVPFTFENTLASVETSLKRLRTDWIDLLQIHDVEQAPYELVINETLPALLKLKEAGKIRFIGVSTRDLQLLIRYIQTGGFDSVQTYTRYTITDHTAKDELLPLTSKHNLGVIQGSPLGMGLIAETPAPFMGQEIIQKAKERLKKLDFLRKDKAPGGLIEPAMRFALTNPYIHVTLTGAVSTEILRQNVSYCDGKGLDPNDLQQVYQLFQGYKLFE